MVLLHAGSLETGLLDGPPLWWVGWAFSTITAVTFLAIGVRLVSGLGPRPSKTNPLALATGFIFLTCGGGHMIHSLQMLYPFVFDSLIGTAARVHYMDWHLWAFDGFTAFAGVLYWTQRKRFPALVKGAAMYEDLRARKQDALELNDTVVQDLNAARLAIKAGDHETARELLAAARKEGR